MLNCLFKLSRIFFRLNQCYLVFFFFVFSRDRHILIAIVSNFLESRRHVSEPCARRTNENDDSDGRGIEQSWLNFVEVRGWDRRLWLTARGCKKRTCLETSCFRVGGQLLFRDELVDFSRAGGRGESGIFRVQFFDEWRGGRGGVEKAVTVIGE